MRLPVKQRVEYKLCTIVLRCLYGDAPSYMVDLNKLPSHHRLMQSTDTFRRHLKTFLFHQAFLSLLGALVVLLQLRRRNLDFLDR